MAPTAVDVLPFIAGLRGPAQCTCFDRGAVVDAREGATIHAVCRRGGGTKRYRRLLTLTLPLSLTLVTLTLSLSLSLTLRLTLSLTLTLIPTLTLSLSLTLTRSPSGRRTALSKRWPS